MEEDSPSFVDDYDHPASVVGAVAYSPENVPGRGCDEGAFAERTDGCGCTCTGTADVEEQEEGGGGGSCCCSSATECACLQRYGPSYDALTGDLANSPTSSVMHGC